MQKLAIVTLVGLSILSTLVPAQAEGRRVREVNGRRANQNRRISAGVRDGQLTHAQAQTLRQNDQSIHSEEKTMRAADNGHLTSADKTSLNQQLNTNSQAIHSERTAGSSTGSTTGGSSTTTTSTSGGTSSVWGNQ